MRVAIQLPHAKDFSTAFLKVLADGDTPVLLPNFLPGTLASLNHEFDMIIYEPSPAQPRSLSDLNPEAEMVLFTSGSNGNPKRIVKRLRHLLNEIRTLDEILSGYEAEAIYATVSHQHIYGLLFSVLWPLYSGRELGDLLVAFPEQLTLLDERHANYALISSPSFLARVTKEMKGGRNCRLITSSGGPLSLATAQSVFEVLKSWPLEFFGSSETGGVAWRTQADSNDAWTLLKGITAEVTTEGLRIQSPFIPEPTVEMNDQVEWIEGGRFRHIGRSDRIAKVEGKRVSLTEIENRIRESPLVQDAAACAITTYREQIGCVVALSDAGKVRLKEVGPREFKRELRSFLSRYFEPVTLPKKFQVVEQIKHNSQAKVESAWVLEQFKTETRPILLGVEVQGDTATLQLIARGDLEYFQGHFPAFSLLPGVVQVNWAIGLAKTHLGVSGRFQELEVIKFVKPILPDSTLNLRLQFDRAKRRLEFTYQCDGEKNSTGRILFGDSDGV